MQIQNWLDSRMEGSHEGINDEGDHEEGVIEDPLMDFFNRYNLKQKELIYNKLKKEEIDYNELMQFEETYFCASFKDILTSMQLSRLFNVLKSHSESAIYKEKQKKVVYVRVPVSCEEEKALNLIETSMNANKSQIKNLSEIQIPKLTQSAKQNKAVIESIFDEIIKCAMNRKDELQQELNRKTHEKTQYIQTQINDLKERQKSIHQWYQRSKSLVNDLSLDASQRKSEILSLRTKVLDITPRWSSTSTEMNVKKQQIQIDAIKVKLMKVALIQDDINDNNERAEYKEESEESPSIASIASIASAASDHASIKSEELQPTKTQKRRKRRSKKKEKKKSEPFLMAAKGEAKPSGSAPPPSSVTPSAPIVVQNTYHAAKDRSKRPIVDSWPMEHPANTHAYKQILCKFWKELSWCRNGKDCTYAHGVKELKKYNANAKTKVCPYVLAKQICPSMNEFNVCNYIHPKNKKKIVKK